MRHEAAPEFLLVRVGRRERFVVATLIIILVATLYSWLVQTAYQERRKLAASVITLKSRAAVVEQQASEIERIRTMPAQAASPTDLRTLVQAQANSAGISRALVKIQSSTPNRLEIEFGDIPFSAWTAWVGNLQSQHVALKPAVSKLSPNQDACRSRDSDPRWGAVSQGKRIAAGIGIYLIALIAYLPASILDRGLAGVSEGRLRLVESHGTLWSGAGRMEIRDASGRQGVSETIAWRVSGCPRPTRKDRTACQSGGVRRRIPASLSLAGIEVGPADLPLPSRDFSTMVPCHRRNSSARKHQSPD